MDRIFSIPLSIVNSDLYPLYQQWLVEIDNRKCLFPALSPVASQ